MSKPQINLVLVDNDSYDKSKLREILGSHNHRPLNISHYNSRNEAINALNSKNNKIDIVVLDLFLTDRVHPKELYIQIQEAAGDAPIIIVTDKASRSLALTIAAHGASDLVVKERLETHPNRLLDAIDFSIIRHRLNQQMKDKHEDEIQDLKQTIRWMNGGYSFETEADLKEDD